MIATRARCCARGVAISRAASTTTTSTRTAAAAAAAASSNRAIGSKCRHFTTKTPQKPPTPTAAAAAAAPKNLAAANRETAFETAVAGDMSNPPDVQFLEVTPKMKMANAALAVVLCGFVGGVWYYSMISVGSQQAGDDGSNTDPLAQLKLEAQEALDRQEKENKPDDRAKNLLEEFTRGDHDPDKAELDALEELEEMDAADANNKKKKAWYKFW